MTRPLADTAAESGKRTVLVVEDEALIRLDLAEALRDVGYRVVECASAGQAVDVLNSGQPIDALVTDVRTPGPIDGLELARQARANDPSVPIVVISGHLDPQDARDADLFLRKPLAIGTLHAALEQLFGHRSSQG